MPSQSTMLSIVRAVVVLGTIALTGCESKVTVQLSTELPADPAITAIQVALEGVEFRKGNGDVERLTFDEPQAVNLLSLQDGNSFRLFTDEELPDGSYSGVRLLLTEDDNIDNRIISEGREFELALATTNNFSEVDFTVDKDESSDDSIMLTLDLRQSLPFDEADTTLTPVLRAIREEDAGGVAGSVAVSCPANSSLAIYLFSGENQTPDDFDGADAEPYLTTGVAGNPATTSSYAFSFLPEGRYTLATTCRGDDERPGSSEELDFRNVTNVEVEADATEQINLPNG